MAELTNREKLLIVLLSTIVNPMWNEKPWKEQYETFRRLQAIHAPGKYSDNDLNDLVEAIHETYKEIAKESEHIMKNFGK